MDIKDILDFSKISSLSYTYQGNYPHEIDVDINILKDMEIYTDLEEEVKTNPQNIFYVKQLEKYRGFRDGFLVDKGIMFADNFQIINRFPILKHTTLQKTDNHFLDNKFLLPVKLINGEIFSYMAYDAKIVINKYSMPNVQGSARFNYTKQGNILGNLDSIERIGGNEIYFAEGFFDAYRIEERFNKPAVAILGSKITRNKLRLLTELKRRLSVRFIYVPDYDENKAGTDEKLIGLNVWDSIFDFNKNLGTGKKYKDIDQYFRDVYKKEMSGD